MAARTVSIGGAGGRLDELLRERLPGHVGKISNSKVRRLIVAGAVSVDGRQERSPARSVRRGARVSVLIDEGRLFAEKSPGDVPFELTERGILYEDADIIAVDKPALFPSEATFAEGRDNLHAAVVRFLFARQKVERPNAKNPPYAGIVHRLDRDTSGVMLFTKARGANAACHEMFERRTAEKTYLAAVGPEAAAMGEFAVEFPMGRTSRRGEPAKWGRVPESEGGLPSRTEFTVVGGKEINGRRAVIIECRPHTGRTHQIRVHLASLGLPIIGDRRYGGAEHGRLLLHALRLSFPLPSTGERISVESPPPEELRR